MRELKEEGRIRDDEIVRKVRRKTLPKEKVSKEITEGTKRQDNAQLQQMTEEEREKRILELFETEEIEKIDITYKGYNFETIGIKDKMIDKVRITKVENENQV